MSTKPSTENKITVSVIIVNYNGLRFLGSCLEALISNLTKQYEIIIVDNNSSDGSADYLNESWPDAKLISSQENLGFARGNNLGAKHANGKYLLLLNNDTEVLESLQPLVDYLDDHSGTAIVGGRLRNPDGTIQGSVGNDHNPLRIVLNWVIPRTMSSFSKLQLFEKRIEFYKHHHPDVDWVSGAFLCIRKTIWEDLGGFDSDIFMYVEDADLCYRVREKGYKVAYLATSDTRHYEGGGKKGISEHALSSTVDSYKLVLKKQYGRIVCTLTCLSLSLVFIVRAALFYLCGLFAPDTMGKIKAGHYLHSALQLLR